MARFTDTLPQQQGWIHELAKTEIHPDAEKLLNYGRSFDPQQLVEESTVNFLTELRDQFSEYARIFNGYSENNTRFQEVKVYSLAQGAADFMVFRNQIKLLVSNSAHGVIRVSFSKHIRGGMAVDGQIHGGAEVSTRGDSLGSDSQELMAQIGPFRDVFWTFAGERVTAEQVARFYFSEFVRATRDSKRSKPANKVLIEQIKSLLEKEGLEI